jgi:hypothetical protein
MMIELSYGSAAESPPKVARIAVRTPVGESRQMGPTPEAPDCRRRLPLRADPGRSRDCRFNRLTLTTKLVAL